MNYILQLGEYEFNADAKTVKFLAKQNLLNAESLVSIINVKTHETIYDIDNDGLLGSISGDTVTLVFNTKLMDNMDSLRIEVFQK